MLEKAPNTEAFLFYYNMGLTLDAVSSSMGIELE